MNGSIRVIKMIMKADLITGIKVMKPFTIIRTERDVEARSKETEINISTGMIETALCSPQENEYSTHIFLRIGCEIDHFPRLLIGEIVALEDKGMIEIIMDGRDRKMTEKNQNAGDVMTTWDATDDLSALINTPKIFKGGISHIAGLKSDPKLVAGVANESPLPGKDPFF